MSEALIRRRTCFWCSHPMHAGVCQSATRSVDEESRCGCERFDNYRNGLLTDLMLSGLTDAEREIAAIEAEAVATALSALRERVEGLYEAERALPSESMAARWGFGRILALIDEALP